MRDIEGKLTVLGVVVLPYIVGIRRGFGVEAGRGGGS